MSESHLQEGDLGRTGYAFMAAIAAFALAAPAAAQEPIKGIVVTNEGGVLTVKTPAGNQTIMLDGNVRIRSISGALGGQKEEMPPTSLIPGLSVEIEGTQSADGLVATEIDFKAKDYKTAAQIQAGTEEARRRGAETAARAAETARREAELRSSYEKVGQWDVRAEKSVYFKTNSAVISGADKAELLRLAAEAKGYNGYVISVLGYADPRGKSDANERLSNKRAQAVINYIKQSGGVLPGRVLSASAMGEVQLNGATDDPSQHASMRRVTVRVLTSAAMLPPK
jgi:outer membrane protein OmpA-like peptidoglycan-associated protein